MYRKDSKATWAQYIYQDSKLLVLTPVIYFPYSFQSSFMGRLGRATCTSHLISAPDKPGRQTNLPLQKLRAYCSNIYWGREIRNVSMCKKVHHLPQRGHFYVRHSLFFDYCCCCKYFKDQAGKEEKKRKCILQELQDTNNKIYFLSENATTLTSFPAPAAGHCVLNGVLRGRFLGIKM